MSLLFTSQWSMSSNRSQLKANNSSRIPGNASANGGLTSKFTAPAASVLNEKKEVKNPETAFPKLKIPDILPVHLLKLLIWFTVLSIISFKVKA